MNIKDAFSILNISGHTNPTDIKTAYRKAAAKFHPDHNPAGLEMMKLVNVAYEALKDFDGNAEQITTRNYGEAINEALNAIISFGLDIEICGAWVWLSGNTRIHREALKAAGFKWAPKKTQWYFRPEDYKSANRSSWTMDKIRGTYGTEKITSTQKQLFAAT